MAKPVTAESSRIGKTLKGRSNLKSVARGNPSRSEQRRASVAYQQSKPSRS